MAAERRALWLGGILIVAIVAAIVVRSMDSTTERASPPRPSARGRAADRSVVEDQTAPAGVNLSALTRSRGEPAETGRDPFRFRPKPAPPPPSAATGSAAGKPTFQPPAAIIPSGPPPPPPITLKFVGLVEKADGTRIAVLTDGHRPIYGVEGQEVDGRYKILKIGVESVEISYLDGRGRQTIHLSGK
jgi:hypothetical protein